MGMQRGSVRAVLLALVIVLPIHAFACPIRAYLGLYVDSYHSDCRQDITVPFTTFTVWVWVLPNLREMECVEYRLEKPDWTIHVGTVYYSMVDPVGEPDWFGEGGEACFDYCRLHWTWICQYQMVAEVANVEGFISIHERYSNGHLQITTCDAELPVVPIVPITYLAINQPCDNASGSMSWGAIKNLYEK